ncbi:MAG TPA: ketopantoate reductase family protein [Casimicrobiaceae bacterium]|nr:ketopantoate reductase family protein [Casimicrobiaceae bacterium]
MTITIYGSGAIGGVVGAFMARAGEDVLFVDKAVEHVHAMNARGLRISGSRTLEIAVRAVIPGDLKAPLGLVFLAVKSQDTEAALDTIAPLAGPDTVVVSLQNGMNPPAIAKRLGKQRVVGAFVSFPADWQGPGHIEQGGFGNIWIGEIDGRADPPRERGDSSRLRRIQQLLAHAVNAHLTDNVIGYLWSKQIDCSLLFAQTVGDQTFADTFGDARYQPLLVALVGEGVGVALAAGVKLETFGAFEPLKLRPRTPAEEAEARAVLNRFADQTRNQIKVRSGPWRDLAVRQRPTEIDHMVGWVIAEGRRLGVPTPLNEALVQQVKALENGTRQRGLGNLDELEALRGRLYPSSMGPR